MTKQLFITRLDEVKTSAVLFDGDRLVSYFAETALNSSRVGNIYRGKVRRVVPMMQAVFVDIGLSEPGFLAARDAGKAANSNDVDLNDIFREGQVVWVQVTKDAVQSIKGLESKGVRLTTELSIDTSNLVYFPNNHAIHLSKKIQNNKQRQQLKQVLQNVVTEQHITGGFIVRSNVIVVENDSWVEDAKTLWSDWQDIKHAMRNAKKVGLAHQSSTLSSRLLKIVATEKVENVVGVASAQSIFKEKVDDFKTLTESEITKELNTLNFEEKLNQALVPLVELPKGGSIVIEETEALTAIDVNMGSAAENHLNALELNLMAAKVIAQQLRLRNISGMIIVDFINMATKVEQDSLLQKTRQLLSEDDVRVHVYGYTRLGLIELSRERIYPSLKNMVSD